MVILAIVALASLRLIVRPSLCQALESVYQDFARGDGFVTFDDFISNEISVETKRSGLHWTQFVTYPNPKISLAFDQQLATKVTLDFSPYFGGISYSSINIPRDELDGKFNYVNVCGG